MTSSDEPNIALFLVALLILHIIDKKRKRTIIFYDIDENEENKIQEFYDSFNDIIKSKKKWHILSSSNTYNIKQSYGGASSSLKMKPIKIKYKTPPHIKTNVKSICIPVGKQCLYFFPDKVLIYDKMKVGALDYKSLEISSTHSNFIWLKGFKPSDSTIVKYTYAHVNVNGTPDRRFSNNPQIPVLDFNQIHFSSNNGLNEEILVSKSNAGDKLISQMNTINYPIRINSNTISSNNIENDPLLFEAIEAIIEQGNASTSFVQRKFNVGYARAGRIIDQMENLGIISEYKGSTPRSILVSNNEWIKIKNRIINENNQIKSDSLKDKINKLNSLMDIMDSNNLGYKDFINNIGTSNRSNIDTKRSFEFLSYIFINYIVDSNLTHSDYVILEKYLGAYVNTHKMTDENEFNYLFASDYKNQKDEPYDWYCFYFEEPKLKEKGLIDNNINILDLLINVYSELGNKIVQNATTSEERIKRQKRCTDYIEYCKNKFNEIAHSLITSNSSSTSTSSDSKKENNDDKSLEEYIDELNSLIGLDNVKEDVNSLINLIKVRKIRKEKNIAQKPMSLHLVFSGNPGTGKTTVARLISKIYYKMGVVSKGTFVEADRSDLIGGYVGQTAIKTKEVCNNALGGILFIDEAYSLTSSKDSNDFGKEAIETLLKFMEDHRDDFIVIVAGYTDLMEEFLDSNPGLKSRFNKYIYFNDYTPAELLEIYIKLCNDSEFILSNDAKDYVKQFFENRYKNRTKNYANARDVRNFFEKTIVNQANRISADNIISNDELQTIELDDVKNIKLKT